MKAYLYLLILLGLPGLSHAQLSQIVFEADSGNGSYSFWSVEARPGAAPINLSTLIDAQAKQAGRNDGPINVSHNGQWYSFVSEQFDTACADWGCLTIANADFSTVVSVKDIAGNVVHNERIAMVCNDGKAVVYAADNGPHARDIFIIHKTPAGWSIPKLLSSASSFAYNINPRFSFDGTSVIFQGGEQEFPGESIYTVDSSGTNFIQKIINTAAVNGIAGCSEVHMPCFAPDGSIYFEGHWGGERLWHLPNGATVPILVDAADGNDNSPVVLPDGQIASLQLPDATHDMKVQHADGTAKFFLTGSTSAFPFEVYDNGMGAGLANQAPATSISQLTPATEATASLYPNPSAGPTTLYFAYPESGNLQISIINSLGQRVQEPSIIDFKASKAIAELKTTALLPGLYYVKVTLRMQDGKQIETMRKLQVIHYQ